jgi:hypothetical protein
MEDSVTHKATLYILDDHGSCTISFDRVMLKDPSGLGYQSHPADGRLYTNLGSCEVTFVLPRANDHHGHLGSAVGYAKREVIKGMLTHFIYATGLLFALIGAHSIRFH